ncbi:hypothetical protein Dda_1614 [Drechslerella dactyloides]|uniref:Peptidase A1 domain-containing protein n=1 Tax=Drechslerella dactyloides TaxID=74499 RepID=A0AAD6J4D3_DREDA|nr:hypothetical protein Dda_1614 [Drechslerella dactyloides]
MGSAAVPRSSSLLLWTFLLLTAEVSIVGSQQIPNLNATALNWPASSAWEGNDGSWGTFFMRLGTPEQIVRVLPATSWQEIWVIDSTACRNQAAETCSDKRGQTFNINGSSTWADRGLYKTDLAKDLGYNSIGDYGMDTVGITNTNRAPTLPNQVVVTVASNQWYTGLFGLGSQPTNFTNFNDPQPSFLTSLYNKGTIPSLSWGYQAGAIYRSKTSAASLVFGGYDTSKYVDNDLIFTQSNDFTYAFLVALSSIKASGVYVNGERGTAELLDNDWRRTTSSQQIAIDSSTAYLWLPNATCAIFERALNLTYNETVGLYLLTEQQHDQLLNANPTFTFTIADSAQNTTTMNLEIPYSAFSLQASGPEILGSNTKSWYFPLKRLPEEGNPRLGRAFMQEIYLFAEYHFGTFRIFQADWSNQPSNIVTHLPTQIFRKGGGSSTPIGAIVGGAVGGVAVIAALVGGWWWWRRRQQPPAPEPASAAIPEMDGAAQTRPQNELAGDKWQGDQKPLAGVAGMHEADGKAAEAGWRHEADGTPLARPYGGEGGPVYAELGGQSHAHAAELGGQSHAHRAELGGQSHAPRAELGGQEHVAMGGQEHAELGGSDMIYEMPAGEMIGRNTTIASRTFCIFGNSFVA